MNRDADRQALEQRISVVRKEIEAIRKARAPQRKARRREEIEALEHAVRDANERLRAARAQRKAASHPGTAEDALRGGLYWAGGLIAATGACTLVFAQRSGVFAEGALWDRIEVGLVLSVPLLLGLALLARARFATYNADKQDLDGDFL